MSQRKPSSDVIAAESAPVLPPHPVDAGHFLHFHRSLFLDPTSQAMKLMNLLQRCGRQTSRDEIIGSAGRAPKIDHSIRAVPVLQLTLATPAKSLAFALELFKLSLEMNGMRLFSTGYPFDQLELIAEVNFVPDSFRWTTVDLLSCRLPMQGGFDIDAMVKPQSLPDLAVLYAAVLFPEWVKAFGCEVGGEFVPIPIMRSFQRVYQPATIHEHIEALGFLRNNNQVMLAGHEVKSTVSNWHYCVPTVHRSPGW